MAGPRENEPNTDSDIFGTARRGSPGPAADYPESLLPLSAAPYYMPNLIAGIVASVGIVAGSIGPWASIPTLDLAGVIDNWGVVALVVGGASAVALFVVVNWGRTTSSLRWAVPLCWAVLVAGVSCLAIAIVNIVTILSFRDELEAGANVQVAWGLWLVAISSGVLCVTAPIVAAQISKAAQSEKTAVSDTWVGAWRWAAVIVSGVVLLVAMASAYKPLIVGIDVQANPETATRTVTAEPETVTAAPGTQYLPVPARPRTVPAGATPCPSNFSDGEFPASAAGTSVTSCEFAEEIRRSYVGQPVRDGVVDLYVTSPVTREGYTVRCSGNSVVRCTGGTNAVAYLY